MTKITPDHLARQAIVYIRQSTADQVTNNLESQRRQYNLPERARQLGWSDVAVIDDDLGRSGRGLRALDSRSSSPPFAKAAWGLSCRSKPHGSPATAGTGTAPRRRESQWRRVPPGELSSWRAAWSGNWPGRSLATKVALGG